MTSSIGTRNIKNKASQSDQELYGRTGNATIREFKKTSDKMAEPLEILLILRSDTTAQHLVAVSQKRAGDDTASPLELIRTSHLP